MKRKLTALVLGISLVIGTTGCSAASTVSKSYKSNARLMDDYIDEYYGTNYAGLLTIDSEEYVEFIVIDPSGNETGRVGMEREMLEFLYY